MKGELYGKAIIWVTKKGFKEIKANTEDYETPAAFIQPNAEKSIVPDISGRVNGSRSYAEIVSKEENEQTTITKWKLLGSVAARKGGKLYLLASRGYKTFAEQVVKNYNLQNAHVVSI